MAGFSGLGLMVGSSAPARRAGNPNTYVVPVSTRGGGFDPTQRRIPGPSYSPGPTTTTSNPGQTPGPGFPADPGVGGGGPVGDPVGDIFTTGVNIACAQLSGWQRELCLAGGQYINRRYISPGERGTGMTPTSCPPGWVQKNGGCVPVVPTADPGGADLGRIPGEAMQTVMGSFGMPAIVPFDVGDILRGDGTMGPILRCPGKYILGDDSLCYPKGSIPNKWRKWPKGPRPLLSAMDGKILRHARSVEKRLRRVSSKYVPRPRVLKSGRRK